MIYQSSKIIPLGSCAFRQPFAESHCKFLHGYRLQAKIWVSCAELDNKNWVYDFGGFKGIKNLLENQFDHTTVISIDDPHIETFKDLSTKGIIDLRVMDGVGIEKFAEYVLNVANAYIQDQTNKRCWVSEVEVWEHEQNSAKVTNNFTLQVIQVNKELHSELKDEPLIKKEVEPNIEVINVNTTKQFTEQTIQQPTAHSILQATTQAALKSTPQARLQATLLANPPATPQSAANPLYAQKSKGWSDPFKGTSWGNK